MTLPAHLSVNEAASIPLTARTLSLTHVPPAASKSPVTARGHLGYLLLEWQEIAWKPARDIESLKSGHMGTGC